MPYLPIENYGIIGDLHTVALVGTNGSIDWFCYPTFDSPSVFAAILDDRKGGRFQIAPADGETRHKQFYWPETNVLVTRFLSPDGVGQVTDFMPVGLPEDDPKRHQIVRLVRVVRGSMAFEVECRPAFNYARDPHTVVAQSGSICFRSPRLCLGLATRVPLDTRDNGVVGRFVLEEGEAVSFVLGRVDESGDCSALLSEGEAQRLVTHTERFWQHWLSFCTYRGRWRETVQRSALALKLMTFEPSGAIVAAPTCSLPEVIGGERNWDYRYTWMRDAAFTLYALMRIGFTGSAERFMNWLETRCHALEPDGSLELMYAIDGSRVPDEEVLSHLEGYRGSSPVRIGNAAHRQLQLDIYGDLMDSVYLFNKYGSPISFDLWRHLRRLVNWVCDNWQRDDDGIWEVRSGRRPFVFSKMMCWVAVDRALRLATKRSFPADWERWMRVRDQIYEELMAKGWSRERKAFVQAYGTRALDAANLMMPLVFFLSPTDPRNLMTIDATLRSPQDGGLTSNGLVYRYNHRESPDGLEGREGTFNICTFWLVEALTRAGQRDPERLKHARLMFEEMLGYTNHLGLYAEQTGRSGEALGNFPQAFTHLALVSAAFNLNRALGGGD